jgi:uncharacterized membrane protein YgdD (TMEM256/DUF423 family)
MQAVARRALMFAAVNGLLAVALGAFGAHGLQTRLATASDGAARLGWWETAAHYQLGHVVAFVLCAWLLSKRASRAAHVATTCFALGVIVFSGSLYLLALTGTKAFGVVTPIGGLLLLSGWAGALWSAASLPHDAA